MNSSSVQGMYVNHAVWTGKLSGKSDSARQLVNRLFYNPYSLGFVI